MSRKLDSMYEIREAREEDREQTVDMLVRVFKEIESFEEVWVESWKNYMNKPEHEDWDYIATHNGDVVANLAFFANSHNLIRGGVVRFGGVWAVATDTKHRRKGILRSLYEQVFHIMKKKEITLSILEPSPYEGAQPAYERMGYEVVEKRVHHEFSPIGLRSLQTDETITTRLLDDEKEWKLVAELEKSMARYGSTVFTWPGFLIGGIKAGNFYVFERDGVPVGCVNLGFSTKDSGNEIYMMNTYFASNDVIPSILQLVSQKASDVTKVVWNCSSQIPVRTFFQSVHTLHTKVDGAMMMRIVDFEGYCKSIKVSEEASEELSLKLIDKECPWNDDTYRLECSKGTLTVDRTGDATSPNLTLTSNELSRIVGGAEAPSMLQEMGLINCQSDDSEKLDVMFPKDSFISYFRF
ncbi:MAG: GNAT family N-acetyltransferase [Candidatus Thorarchaeota archaeon]|nr:GNAT family N-acetyltransferase [Candidatus Thorarchaeota archaeon]